MLLGDGRAVAAEVEGVDVHVRLGVSAGHLTQVDPVDQLGELGPALIVGVEVDLAVGDQPGEAAGTAAPAPAARRRWAVAAGPGPAVPAPGVTPTVRPGLLDLLGVLARRGDGGRGEGGEVGAAGQPAGEGGVPDPAGALRRRAADRGRRELEGAVGDAGVEVDAAVVVGGVDVVVHVAGLRVLAEDGVVVRRAGVGHVAQRPRLDAGQEQPGPDQPVARHGVLAEQPLLEAGGEDVGDRLVERARTGPRRPDRRCAR